MANHRLRFRYFRYRFAMAPTVSALCVKCESSALKQDRRKVAGKRRFVPLFKPFTSSAVYIDFHFFQIRGLALQW